jgi:hypothetical protein
MGFSKACFAKQKQAQPNGIQFGQKKIKHYLIK